MPRILAGLGGLLLAALQQVRPNRERGKLAWRRLERGQAALETTIDVLRRSV